MEQLSAFLISKRCVAQDVYHLHFYVTGRGLSYEPGQYVVLTIPSSPTPLKRLYSLAGANSNKNMFELLIELIPGGAASEYISSLHVGDTVPVAGPAGVFSPQKTLSKKIFMVTGTGFAPIRSFFASSSPNSLNCTLYWGLRDLSKTYMIEELLSLKRTSPTFHFYCCFSHQPSFDIFPADLLHYFRAGHIDTVWASQTALIDPSNEYYLCGSRVVVESLRLLLLSKGVLKSNIYFEKY